MGSAQSMQYPAAHVRIYQNLLAIQSPQTRAEMIQTLMAAPEYVQSFKNAGVYSYLIQYVSRVQRNQAPGLLPGEQQQQQQPSTIRQRPQAELQTYGNRQQTNSYAITTSQAMSTNPYERIMEGSGNQKALSYFQTCLQILGLEEEVALTESELKKAYKKTAMKAHPDKGGSERNFEAVTRAYAYLTEILNRIQGGRAAGIKTVEAPSALKTERQSEAEAFKQVEPVRLNPNKLDLNAFNQMFEQTRIPDPDEDGYGDWLKNEADVSAPKFSGKFNRDVFHKMFEDEVGKSSKKQQPMNALIGPQALYLAPSMGVELGRGKPDDYTAAIGGSDASLRYTDLRAAYTTENTFSGQVADVNVEERKFSEYQASRKRAPDPLRNEEMEAITAMEKEAEAREKRRQLRAAQEHLNANDYHERMKRLVITDGVPLDRSRR
jgi:curved DNA-binding protein CbpA